VSLPAESRKPLVLVADDHEDTRSMLEMLLTTNGFDVALYEDGETALADAIRLAPNLVVLDGHLHRLDGCDVARGIRAHGAHQPPIIFVSGYGDDEHETRARAAGCNHYLLKPVNLDVLLRLVRRLTAHTDHNG
jgi:DNA-binding response OmpR family regulator